MSGPQPIFYKVDIKPKKKEPCRICNTKIRPTIDVLSNKNLLDSITSALDIIISPESRLSKRICVVCMALVNLLSDFKKICYNTQNDLWKMEQHLVKDRNEEIGRILNKVKQVTTFESPQTVKSDESIDMPKTRPKSFIAPSTSPVVTNTPPKAIIYPKPKVIVLRQEEKPPNSSNGIEEGEESCFVDHEDDVEINQDLEEKNTNPDFSTEYISMDIDREEEETEQIVTKNYQCTVSGCEQVCNSKESLNDHVQKHSEGPPKIFYQCQQCSKNFLEIHELVAHRKTHPNPTGQKCGYCRTEFSVDTIANHVVQCAMINKRKKQESASGAKFEVYRPKQMVIAPDDKLFKCGICSERFQSITEYRNHHKAHKGDVL